jgi:pre-mRNA-splicing factor ATP-dependent RNA helicase DHX15/PRP43
MKRRLDVGGGAAEAETGDGGSGDGVPSVNPLTGTPYSRRYREIYEQRKKLPVWQFLDQFQKLVSENQVIVVEGETGSGKTTQVGGWLERST